MSNLAWVTLATNDSYGLGALVLAHSLRRAGSAYPAVVLITPSVTDAMRDRLSAVFADVVMVDVLDSGDAAHLALLQRPELGITFTKIHCWNLTQYEKCVFLDADILVVQNCDELFEREELSAAPDVGWPDCFNSGVFVYKPSAETFAALIEFAQQRGSFDGGDQGLLNSYFSDWAHGDINKHLPFLYNVTSAAFYSYLPALKHYGRDLKIIHFIGAAKPWLQQFDWRSRQVQAPEHLREFLQLWWDLFVGQVHIQLDPSMVEVEDEPTTIEPEQEAHVYTELQMEYNHYKPVLDADSEFHWHRPDAQLNQSEAAPPEIDLTQFHDPWAIYKGHFPPLAEEAKIASYTCSNYQGDQQENRRHIWEAPQRHACHSEIQHEQNSQYSQSDATQFYHDNYYNTNHENLRYSQQDIEPYDNNKETQHGFNYSIDQQTIFSRDLHNFTHSFDQRNSWIDSQQYDNTSQHSHGFNSQHPYFESQQFHETALHHESQQFYESGFNNQQDYAPADDKCKDTNQENDTNHSNHINSSIPNQSNQHSYTNGTYDSLDYDHMVLNHVQEDVTQFTHSLRNRVEYVYSLHLDHDKGRYRQKRNLEKLLPISEKTNGDTECEVNGHEEFIIPRHPYDGFYLRHRVTVDARGRKICTHEIPPTPSPSISPPESPIFFDAVSECVSQEDACSKHEDNSGVAGNLARVTPEAIGAQSEAIDELTRRQGWEAGNIDYMGADSFDNIWAKISQTLSQPPASPPKQPTPPPAEVAPAKETDESIPAKESEEPKKPEEPVAPTQSKQPQEEPVGQSEVASIAKVTTTEATVAADTIPSEIAISAPSENAAPLVEPAVEVITPKELVPAAESGTQDAPAVATAEVPVSKKAIPAAEAITQTASSEEASLPVETADIPAESPVEIPVPVVEAVLAEAAAPESGAPITAEELPAPVLEASAAVEIPKVLETAPELTTAPVETPVAEKAVGETKLVKAAKEEPPKQEVHAAAATAPTVAAEASPPTVDPIQSAEKPAKPENAPVAPATDSPPLANTPSTEDVPAEPADKSEARRRPAGKLQLSPPLAADPLPTPDSELEDAASLAQSIIASELRTPTVTSPTPPHPASPAQLYQEKRLSVEGPQIPTPPVGSVSLSQIGVKAPKGKATIAAQIESSVADKPATAEPKADAPKKKVVKKVLKKDTSGEAPVPPPRKKEKKPKEK